MSPIAGHGALAAVLAVGAPLVTLIVHANPSGAGPVSPFSGWPAAALVSVATGIVSFILFFVSLRARTVRANVGWVGAGLVLHLVGLVALGLSLHRDYFTLVFTTVFAFLIVYVSSFRTRHDAKTLTGPAPPAMRDSIRHLVTVVTAVTALVSVWIILMGYAISTRAEPRWAESILYNVYFVVLVVIMVGAISSLRGETRRTVCVAENSFVADGHEFAGVLGEVNLRLLNQFMVSRGESLQCSQLALAIPSRNEPAVTEIRRECEECRRQRYTATNCRRYRNLYNRIRDIRNLLESLEVGTILSPENKMNVVAEGWKLMLFENVAVRLVRGTGDTQSDSAQN